MTKYIQNLVDVNIQWRYGPFSIILDLCVMNSNLAAKLLIESFGIQGREEGELSVTCCDYYYLTIGIYHAFAGI